MQYIEETYKDLSMKFYLKFDSFKDKSPDLKEEIIENYWWQYIILLIVVIGVFGYAYYCTSKGYQFSGSVSFRSGFKIVCRKWV